MADFCTCTWDPNSCHVPLNSSVRSKETKTCPCCSVLADRHVFKSTAEFGHTKHRISVGDENPDGIMSWCLYCTSRHGGPRKKHMIWVMRWLTAWKRIGSTYRNQVIRGRKASSS